MNSDLKELLKSLLDHGAEFLIVGGYAVMEYSEPRFTKDLDVWVGSSPTNAPKVVAALRSFGAPLFGATEEDFATPGQVLQLGVPPNRVDILTSIDGVEFSNAWGRKVNVDFDGITVPFLSLEDLIKNKESTPRERDKREAAELRAVLDSKRAGK